MYFERRANESIDDRSLSKVLKRDKKEFMHLKVKFFFFVYVKVIIS